MRGADLIVGMLADAGVDVVFGLPGGAISPVHDALLDSSIRVITTRHESGAMFAAAGYAHTTGKLGVVAVTSGPGALNAMTGLASAWCDGLPVLLLVGEVPRGAQGKGVLQDGSAHGLQIVEMARHVTKIAAEVPRRARCPTCCAARSRPRCRAAAVRSMLTLPIDVDRSGDRAAARPATVTLGGRLAGRILDEIAELLRDAERPLILAGSGVRGGGAPARLRTVAERCAARSRRRRRPRACSPRAIRSSLGVLGLGGHLSARRYLERRRRRDRDRHQPRRHRDRRLRARSCRHRARSSTSTSTPARSARATRRPTRSSRPAASCSAALARSAAGLQVDAPAAARASSVTATLPPSQHDRPDRAAGRDRARSSSCCRRDTIYTVDSGEHFLFATHYLEIDDPDAFIVMTGLGSMGQSIGAAIGAQLAHPRPHGAPRSAATAASR